MLTASEQSCIREELDDRSLESALAGLIAAPITLADESLNFEQWEARIFSCLAPQTAQDVFLAALIAGIAEGVGTEADQFLDELSDGDRECLREWARGIDPAMMIAADFTGDSPSFAAVLFGVFACVPDLFIAMMVADMDMDMDMDLAELSDGDRECLREGARGIDPAMFADGQDGAEVDAAFFGMFACVPDLFIAVMVAGIGVDLAELSDEDWECLREGAGGIDPAMFADGQDGPEVDAVLFGVFACLYGLAGDDMFDDQGDVGVVEDVSGVLWEYDAGWEPYAPTVSGDTVYLSAFNDVVALDAATGELRWSYGWLYADPGAPVHANGLVYVGIDQDGGSYVDAVDAVTGERRWRYDAELKVLFGPVLSEGIVYARSFSDREHAIDGATGEPVWKRNLGSHSLLSAAVVADGAVLVESTSEQSVFALDAATGETLWVFATVGDPSPPTVSGGVVYVQSTDGVVDYVAAVDAAGGEALWRYQTGAKEVYLKAWPVVSDGIVYVLSGDSGGNYVEALDAAGGQRLWRYHTPGYVVDQPLASGGVAYLQWEDDDGGYLHAVDAATGEPIWQYDQQGRWSAAPVEHDGIVYAGAFDGRVHALDAATGELLSQYRLRGYVSTITVSGGVVYVATASGLTAIEAIAPPR